MNKKIKVFTFDYLLNNELSEEDLHYIFDTNSLKYSLIYEMFKIAKYNMSNDKINTIISNKDWMYKYFWNLTQRNKFRENLKNVYKIMYYCSDNTGYNKADEFLLFYGLTNSKIKKNKHIHTLEE